MKTEKKKIESNARVIGKVKLVRTVNPLRYKVTLIGSAA